MPVNAYRQFVQAQMDQRGWKQADLVRKSGLSRAVISRLLTDKQERLSKLPSDSTIKGLAKAFTGVRMEARLWLAVAEAMGIPVDAAVLVGDPALLSDDDLVQELSRRFQQRRTRDEIAADLLRISKQVRKAAQSLLVEVTEQDAGQLLMAQDAIVAHRAAATKQELPELVVLADFMLDQLTANYGMLRPEFDADGSPRQPDLDLAAKAGAVQPSATVGDQAEAGEENQDPEGGA